MNNIVDKNIVIRRGSMIIYKETAQGKIDLGICSLQQAKRIAKEDGGTYIFSSIN